MNGNIIIDGGGMNETKLMLITVLEVGYISDKSGVT
jgi:hypothetical protein